MRNILSREGRELLKEFTWSNMLLALDYDGTLAPIVERPEDAAMRQETRDLLWELTRLYPVIVISGRGQADALKKLEGVGVLEVVGNHGIEPWQTSNRNIAEVQRWLPELVEGLAPYKGVAIEDKIYSIAIHYRQSREKKKARAAILKAASRLGNTRVIGGKQVVNILPSDASHKGFAIERARDRLRCDTAIYVGDDETDEDVFELEQPGRLLAIRVGKKQSSAATYYITNQRAIDVLFRVLVGHRRKADHRRLALP